MVDYEYWSKLSGSDEPSQIADLFALAALSSRWSLGRHHNENKSRSEVHGLYKQSKFPDVSGIGHLGPIILKCWNQEYHTADAIVCDLEVNSKLDLRRDSTSWMAMFRIFSSLGRGHQD